MVIPGMNEKEEERFVKAMELLVEHGYGQMVLVIHAGRVSIMLPAPSILPQDDLPPFILYRQERKTKHGGR